jgi:putative ABC transport system permease protein
VVSEVALSLVLLIGSGLLLRSFVNLVGVNPGFNPENVLTANVGLPISRYPERQNQAAFFQQLVDRTRSLPGVESASAVYPLPLSGAEEGMSFSIEGRPAPPPGEVRSAGPRWVMPDYFRLMGIPLLKGRLMTEQDAVESQQVIVINQAMARRYWPDEDPVGKRMTLPFRGDSQREIIGVVDDVKHTRLDVEGTPEMYIPYLQSPISSMTLVVRTSSDPLGLVAAVRSEVSRLDKEQPVYDVRTMEQLVSESTSSRRFNALLLGIFAGVALILAAIGIYGVMSYSVTRRAHEIGLRMALGAQVRDVLKLVVRQGMLLTLVGVCIGLAAALALTRLLSSLLYGVSATDPITFGVITSLLIGVALLATYIPARRATRVDPIVALRHE